MPPVVRFGQNLPDFDSSANIGGHPVVAIDGGGDPTDLTDIIASVTVVSDGLAAHLADGSAAHAASATSFTPAGDITSTTVQLAIEEVHTLAGAGDGGAAAAVVQANLDDHTDVEKYSAHLSINIIHDGQYLDAVIQAIYDRTALDTPSDPFGPIAANNVQDALEEIYANAPGLGGGGGTDIATDVLWNAKGDLAVGTGADTAVRVPVGANGQALLADSTQASGVAWTSFSLTGIAAIPPIIVSSYEMPTLVKNSANYLCDNTADNVQINDAIAEAASLTVHGGAATGRQRGKVILTGGQFSINGSILMRTGVILEGQGPLTQIRQTNLTAVTGSGGAVGMIKLFDADAHLTHVRDFWLHGNFAGSGTTAHGIVYDCGGSQSAYPDTNPDPDNTIKDLFISDFTGGTRHGIYLVDDARGTQISGCNIRRGTGCAIYATGSPDSHLTHTHIGGWDQDGVQVDGGNWKINNTKVYFCDRYGFNLSNSRFIGGVLETQDCASGVNFAASDVTVAGLMVDTCQTDGVIVNASRVIIAGCNIFQRASGRYATMTNGMRFAGTPTDCSITGVINTTSITNKTSGTTSGARNFIRLGGGAALLSVG
jgi:hypothetical protein